MSSMRLISHHLFVAAAGQVSRPIRKTRAMEEDCAAEARRELAPLEVIGMHQPLPLSAARPLRMAVNGGRT